MSCRNSLNLQYLKKESLFQLLLYQTNKRVSEGRTPSVVSTGRVFGFSQRASAGFIWNRLGVTIFFVNILYLIWNYWLNLQGGFGWECTSSVDSCIEEFPLNSSKLPRRIIQADRIIFLVLSTRGYLHNAI